MENNVKEKKKEIFGGDRKKLAVVIVLALVVIAVIAVIAIFLIKKKGGGSSASPVLQEGVAFDYEKEGYITLGDYKNVSISVEVSDADVEEEINDLLSEEVYEQCEGTASADDIVNINFQAYLDGKPVEDEYVEDLEMALGEEEYFAEFDKEIVGMNTGETKTIEVNVPKDYGYEEIDGKTVQYEVTLNYICGDPVTPELNDDFVTSYSEGACTSVGEFNEYIRNELYESNVSAIAEDVWTEVIEKTTVKKYDENELDKARTETEKSYDSFAEMSGYSSREEFLSDFGMTEEDVEDVAKGMALDKMVAKTIAAKENIKMSDEEYKEKLIEYMEYEDEADKNQKIEDIEKDYEETYSETPKDGIFLEYVKEQVSKMADVKGLE